MVTSPLDIVAKACMDLTETLSTVNNESEKESIVINHIKKVWANVSSVEDFKKDIEWVNVSEPLSLSQHCNEKIVVLDFWTYCCINCYHVLPDLAYLERLHAVEDGVVVIGVHTAKFSNEKNSKNVLAAVQRYGINHPVVNDPDSRTWDALGICCWPTLLILGPNNKPIFVLTGEGHRKELVLYVGAAVNHFSSRISKASLPVSPTTHLTAKHDHILRFPSKIVINPFYRGRAEEPYLAIADAGNHRLLLTDYSGLVVHTVGGQKRGFKDGKLSDALMDSPQGVCWLSSTVLVVCDTGNHVLRTVHLDEGTVELLTGTGKQGTQGDNGGKCLGLQALSSPWDVVLYTTPDMDLSVRAPPPPPPPPPPILPSSANTEASTAEASVEGAPLIDITNGDDDKGKDPKNNKRRVLLIACAGSHQIWALFLDTTVWWKYKVYQEGTCVCIAGSGSESARNSAYPLTASFAQPSGLSLRTSTNTELYIADSESSSIRKISLTSGQVSTLVGGDRNPLHLFAFGDKDGISYEAKLQHPLGVAYCEYSKTLYVADTYNHKIKKVDICTQKITTFHPTMIETTEPARFNEPSGLSLSNDSKYLYITDTNNHSVKILNIPKNVCEELSIRLPEQKFVEPENLIPYKNDLFVNRKFGSLIIYFNVSLDSADVKNIKFTPGAPQNWSICVRDENYKDVTLDDFDFVNSSHTGSKLPGRVQMKLKKKSDKTHYRLYLSFHTSLCESTVCFSHAFTIRSAMLVRDSVKMIESYKLTCKVNPVNRALKESS